MGFAACRGAARVSQCARHFIIKPSIPLSRPGVFHRAFTQPALAIRNQRRLNSSVATAAPSETSRADITNAGTSPSETSSSQPSPAEISTAETSSSASFPQTPSETPPDVSEIDTLSPPWQFKHLSQVEQAAYYEYGPKYATLHPGDKFKSKAKEAAMKRAAFAIKAEKKLGSDWFAVLEAYNVQLVSINEAADAGFRARKDALNASVKFPEDMPASEKNDLEQKRMAGHKAINAEIIVFRNQQTRKLWEDLELFAEEMKNRRG